MSEPKIHEFLENVEINISPATISRILTKNNEAFHCEKVDIFKAGLKILSLKPYNILFLCFEANQWHSSSLKSEVSTECMKYSIACWLFWAFSIGRGHGTGI